MTTMNPSLEALVETGILPGEVFHPGGLDVSRELANLCDITSTSNVLDVACGTGETAFLLAETFGCHVVGIDVTERQIERARAKQRRRNLPVEFRLADAHQLPFPDGSFDVVISEAVLCHLAISKALREMVRVTKPGGQVGMHDLCWQEHTPDAIKQRFVEVEHERPATLAGWTRQFEQAGLVDIRTVDKSDVYPTWIKNEKRQIGLVGQLTILLAILKRWGFTGYWKIRASQRIWESVHMGYGIIAGSKPITNR